MSFLSPADLRPHLRILDDGDAVEDALLQTYIDAAWRFMCRYTRRDLGTEFSAVDAPDLVLVQMQLAAHYYAHPEATSDAPTHEIPFMVKDLLADFRDMS